MITQMIPRTLVAILLLCSFAHARDRQAAREAYKKARSYHENLFENPLRERSLKHYKRAVYLYRSVIDKDPTYGACDDALYAIASLNEEMAKKFQNRTYHRRAIYYYEFLSKEYPLTKHKKAAQKRARLLREKAVPSMPKGVEKIQDLAYEDLATVSGIRYWSSQDYTRVVIQLNREVEFQKIILNRPDRIYFDLKNTRPSKGVKGRTYQVNDLFIKGIRVAQNSPQITRVVLDFEKIRKHTVFALYNPFRIVIDTQGDKQTVRSSDKFNSKELQSIDSQIKTDSDQVIEQTIPVIPAPNSRGDRTLTRVLGLKVGRVVIDPGHGGKDTGTIGRGGLKEKNLVLEVSLHLKKLLEERLNLEVILTRESDKFIPLEERTAVANHLEADLFLSIHANSSKSQRTSGVETFFQGFTSQAEERDVAARENSSSQKNVRELENILKRIALGDYNEESREFANVLQDNFHSATKHYLSGFDNRGVKKAPFIVLINLNMPGILLEIGFLSNPNEERYLKGKAGQKQIAEAIYRGIDAYLQRLGSAIEYNANNSPGKY